MDPIQTEQPVRRERGGKMSNYQPLWEQIKAANQPFLQLTFDRIEAIVQHPLNHSFLNAKKELIEYGYRVHKISCKEQTVWFEKLDRKGPSYSMFTVWAEPPMKRNTIDLCFRLVMFWAWTIGQKRRGKQQKNFPNCSIRSAIKRHPFC